MHRTDLSTLDRRAALCVAPLLSCSTETTAVPGLSLTQRRRPALSAPARRPATPSHGSSPTTTTVCPPSPQSWQTRQPTAWQSTARPLMAHGVYCLCLCLWVAPECFLGVQLPTQNVPGDLPRGWSAQPVLDAAHFVAWMNADLLPTAFPTLCRFMPDTPNSIEVTTEGSFAECVTKCDEKETTASTPGCQWVTYVSRYGGPGHG